MPSEAKLSLVKSLIKDMKEFPVVAVVDIESLPAQQFQKMRATLRKKDVKIVVARKKLLTLALKEAKKPQMDQLEAKYKRMPALLFAKSNPFALYATIQKNKSDAPAKAGNIAPKDIVIKEGPTNFVPGPIISELAAVGIKTKVDSGKLAIVQDAVVAKEGDEISAALASMLKRLDVKPMEIGLNLVAVWEDGFVFDAKTLAIDEDEFRATIVQAAQWATNLSVEVVYPTKDNANLLIQKAFRNAKAAAIEAAYLCDDTKESILAKADAQASAVKAKAKME
ncbi:50S ribosomal protein L10 [archaeon]|jgi:large subunit ribosomal protein L10|nr:50S ribosomal protein L10 [archaeon]MBT6698086.1 50S ribosomal protein L10 [archaeon]